ncbi:Putative F-box/FBD/LRR-repeat protein At4g13965 [Linum grandiflorum]
MENGTEIELGKAAKRLRKEENSTAASAAVDRLSNLPNCVLYHILSFLDTKYAVQTSVLSRVWRCVWKHLNVLNLRRSNFQSFSSYAKFARRALLNRFELDVSKVSFIDDVGPCTQIVQNMLDEVVNFAFAHDCRHLVIDLEVDHCYRSSYRFGTVPSSSLRTLEIRNVVIADGFGSSGFPSLTSLILKTCPLNPDQKGNVDLISNLPSLMDLVIENCYSLIERFTSIVIHGPQLVNLELTIPEVYDIKLVAPKLRSFILQLVVDLNSFQVLSKLNLSSLPSLDHADIVVRGLLIFRKKDMNYYGWNLLFQALHDANSVVLRCNGKQVLKNLCNFLERHPPLFTKLKSLKCVSYCYDESCRVISYHLDGSSCGEAKRLRRRLSNLPNCILYYILSFLDTKYAVQTSVLSRVWRCVWKHVDVLNLRRSNFLNVSSFAKFVRRALLLRFQLEVSKVSFIDDIGPYKPIVQNTLDKVVDYAFAHDCRHLVIDLETQHFLGFSYTFGSVPSHSLRTLEIRNVCIGDGFGSSGFPSLTSLILKTCPLIPDQEGNVDLISNLPSLMDLVMEDYLGKYGKVYDKVSSVVIHGPQLVNLKLAPLPFYNIRVAAPKLRSFSLQLLVDLYSSPVLSKLSLSSLPSLDLAVIMAACYEAPVEIQEFGWNSLFQGLHDAKLLVLGCNDNKVLKNLCDFLERDPHPFTRLKYLVCFTDDKPADAVTYSLDGSSCGEAKYLRRVDRT